MGLLDYLREQQGRRTFSRLHRHWLEEDLPPTRRGRRKPPGDGRNGPTDGMLTDPFLEVEEDPGPPPEDEEEEELPVGWPRRVRKITKLRNSDLVHLSLPLRYIVVTATTGAVLLVALAVLSTVLLMRSCQPG